MKISFKMRISSWLGMLLFVLVFILVAAMFLIRTKQLFENMIKTTVNEQANALSVIIEEKFNSQFEMLKKAVIHFENGSNDIESVFHENINENIKFGIIQLDGSAVCGKELNFDEYMGIKESFHGNDSVCSNNGNLLFTVPVYSGGNIRYVAYKLFDNATAKQNFLTECYSGKGMLAVVDNNKNIVISDNEWGKTSSADSEYEQAVNEVYKKMNTASAFSTIYKNGDERSITFISNITNTEFYVMGDVSVSDVSGETEKILLLVIWVFGLIFILFIVVIIYLMNAEIKVRDRNELREAKLMAENANRAKSDFLANMSHEIRTPINAVLGLDTMILRESNEQTIREYAAGIERAGNTLLSLINDILDLSKIESGKMELVLAKYNLSCLISDVMNMITMKAEAKKLNVELELDENLPSLLYGDDVRIRQILINIMNNAVKYTEHGSVTLCISGKTENNIVHLHFEVRDTGIGIKEEDIGKLFEKFERIEEARNHNVEGTGLGMSITINLLALMNSKLDVKSVYGKGSVFSFDLDQEIRGSEKVGNIKQKISGNSEKKKYNALFIAPDAKVLVVDDNETNRIVFKNLLKQTKLMIDEADGGKSAIAKIMAVKYDIIFIDHMMPDMDGIEVLKHLNDTPSYPNKNTPKIALTANAISGAREEYLKIGFDDYLSKPVNPEKLEIMVADLIPEEKKKIVNEKAVLQENVSVKNEPAAEKADFPAVDGVDWDYAFMKLKTAKLVNSVVKGFVKASEKDINELAEMYDNIIQSDSDESRAEALKSYRIKVHAMKSTSAMLGAMNVSAMAKILEYAARDSDVERINKLMDIFTEEWKKLDKNIKIAFSL